MRRLVLVVAKPETLERINFAGVATHRMRDDAMAVVCEVPQRAPSALIVGPVHYWIETTNPRISGADYDVVNCDGRPDNVPDRSALFIDMELRTATVGPHSVGLHENLRNDPYEGHLRASSHGDDDRRFALM
jgi:hypothetical protein